MEGEKGEGEKRGEEKEEEEEEGGQIITFFVRNRNWNY
jgi:hypothetical protein